MPGSAQRRNTSGFVMAVPKAIIGRRASVLAVPTSPAGRRGAVLACGSGMRGPSEVDDVTAAPRPREPGGRVVIEVRDVEKAFRIPEHRVDSLKERALHPMRPTAYREHRALRGISFDVHEGEFFGI